MYRILFPTDLSETAGKAFEYTLALAEHLDATIDLLTVYRLSSNEAGRIPPDQIEQRLIDKKKEMIAAMRKFLEPYPKDRIAAVRTDYGMFVYQEISDIAAAGKYDLIAVGTRGEHNNMDKLLGSTTTNLMMQAPCPVLAVPANAHFQPIRRIAYATDFQPADLPTVQKLRSFAQILDASVHYVHVHTGGKLEEKLKKGDHWQDFSEFTVVNSNRVTDGLDEYIGANDIQILAMFIPHRRLWERLFHFSSTKQMTFQTNVPLLVFRE